MSSEFRVASSKPTNAPRGLWWWRAAMLLLCLVMTFPSFKGTGNQSIDGSWILGLNLASANHLEFGRDVAWTYGPLGFVFYPMDVGTNLAPAVVGLVLLEFLFLGALGLVLRQLENRLDIVLVGCSWPAVSLSLFTNCLPLMVAAYLVLSYHRRQLRWAIPAIFVAAFSLLGKFNAGLGNAILLAAWGVAMLAMPRRGTLALRLAALAGLYIALVLLLFRLSGNPLSLLPAHLYYSWLIAADYSSAMSLAADHHQELCLAVVMVGFVLLVAWRCYRRHPGAVASVLLAIPLFFAFKAAVVRSDTPHFLIGCVLWSTLLGLALCLTPQNIDRWLFRLALALTIFGCCRLAHHYPPPALLERASQAVAAFPPRVTSPYVVAGDFNGPVPQMPEAWRQLIGQQPVDVYPSDIWLVYVNHLNWRPRLVLQSYSAYAPILDFRGAEFYQGPNAPDFILYRHDAIDDEHPCLVDPQTWLEIVRHYDLVESHEDLFLLQRRPHPRWEQAVVLKQENIPLGQAIQVSGRFPGRVELQARLQLSAVGKLAETLYKVKPPDIMVTYETGESRQFRTVWRNLAGGFLVSDLPWLPSQAQEFFVTGRACPVREIRFKADETLFAKAVTLTWVELR